MLKSNKCAVKNVECPESYLQRIKEMAKINKIQPVDIKLEITDFQQTNRLFLDLLYNLSKYPHPTKAKYLVREGLFAFEEDNLFIKRKRK